MRPSDGFLRFFLFSVISTSLGAVVFRLLLPRFSTTICRLPYPVSSCPCDISASVLPKPRNLKAFVEEEHVAVEDLTSATVLFRDEVHGAESIAVAANGSLYFVDKYNWLLHWHPSGGPLQRLHFLGPGRSLGLMLGPQGDIYVCDALKGLLRFEPRTKRLELLSARVTHPPTLPPNDLVTFADDLDMSEDGVVYWSQASSVPLAMDAASGSWDTAMASCVLSFWKGDCGGRLLATDPATGSTRVVAAGFGFLNGVALMAGGSQCLMADTLGHRLHRVQLQGEQAGRVEVILEGLPALPDGISRAPDGNFWVALPTPHSPLAKLLPYRLARWLLAWWPLPLPLRHWGAVMKVSPEGKVLRLLVDLTGRTVRGITAVTEAGGKLYLGMLEGQGIGVFEL